jgi:hypothetical protein
MSGLRAPVRDETFDFLVCRPLGRRVASILGSRGVTANQVTLVTAIMGVLIGVLYGSPWPGPLWGALLFLVAMVFDCVDGEIARKYGGGGWRGRIFDGMADGVTAISICIGMVVYLGRLKLEVLGHVMGPIEWFVFFLPAAASFIWHSAVVDDVKQRLKHESVDTGLDEPGSEPKNAFERFAYAILVTYARYNKQSSSRGRPGGYLCFRRVQWVGPTHHHVMMVLAALSINVWSTAYLGYWVFVTVIANLYMLTVLWLSRNTCRTQATRSV